MPSIVDMMDILGRLESKALHVEPTRCVKVRNRNASCTRCAEACTSGAISVESNVIDINAEKCTGCGTCTSVCPTSAILCDKPSDAQLATDLERSIGAADGEAVIVCGKAAAHRAADVDKVAEVLCLGRVDVASLIKAVSLGARRITLVDGGCATCKFRSAVPFMDAALEEANDLLFAWESDARVVRTDAVPSAVRAQEPTQALGGVSRRGFFTGMKSRAKAIAAEAASYELEKELGIKRESATLREALKVGEDGCLPHGPIPRHDDLLESLFSIGEAGEGHTLHTRQWASVSVDPKSCDNCSLCVTFCPTGALTKVMKEPDRKPPRSPRRTNRSKEVDHLEFRLCDCVGCGLCSDVCPGDALAVSHEIGASRVFDLEPCRICGEKKRRTIGGARR